LYCAARYLNNVQLGRHGRSRSNVWAFAGVNSFRKGRMDELRAHPTAKPVALVAEAMRDCTRRADIILDTFVGSGTTLMAAERIGRRARAMDIDPQYVDATIRRWQAFTRMDAVDAVSGRTFDQIAADNSAADADQSNRARRSTRRSSRQNPSGQGESNRGVCAQDQST
jgi:hypothetical protein